MDDIDQSVTVAATLIGGDRDADANTAAAAFSGSEPTTEGTTLFTVGGYVLKYMYTISASNATKFLTTDFMPVETDSTVSAAATDGAVESLRVTNVGSGLTDGTYYAAIYGDGSSAGTSSGAIARIVVSSNQIQAFGTVSSTTSGVHTAGSGYTFGTINLGSGFTFSDSALTSASAIESHHLSSANLFIIGSLTRQPSSSIRGA